MNDKPDNSDKPHNDKAISHNNTIHINWLIESIILYSLIESLIELAVMHTDRLTDLQWHWGSEFETSIASLSVYRDKISIDLLVIWCDPTQTATFYFIKKRTYQLLI